MRDTPYNFHKYASVFFLASVLFGVASIGSIIYSEFCNIFVIHCDVNGVTLGAYRWRFDKTSAYDITQDYYTHHRSKKFLNNYYGFMRKNGPILSWMRNEIKHLIRITDVSPEDAMLFVNFALQSHLPKSKRYNFDAKMRALPSKFTFTYRHLTITHLNPTIVNLALYLSLNAFDTSPERPPSLKILMDFQSSSFSIVYYADMDLVKKHNETNRTIQFDFDSHKLNLYSVKNNCFGEFQTLLWLLDQTTSMDGNSPCIPVNYTFSNRDMGFLDNEDPCTPFKKMNFTITGTGNSAECKTKLENYLLKSKCDQGNKTRKCIVVPKSMPNFNFEKNTKMYISNGPATLLKDLEQWNNLSLKSKNFPDDYIKTRKMLCDEDEPFPANEYEKLDQNQVYKLCWKMIFYESLFEMYQIPLIEWQKINFLPNYNGIARGIAMLEANAHENQIVFRILTRKKPMFIILTLSGLTLIYFFSISMVYQDFPRYFWKRPVFMKYFAIMIYFKGGYSPFTRFWKRTKKTSPKKPLFNRKSDPLLQTCAPRDSSSESDASPPIRRHKSIEDIETNFGQGSVIGESTKKYYPIMNVTNQSPESVNLSKDFSPSTAGSRIIFRLPENIFKTKYSDISTSKNSSLQEDPVKATSKTESPISKTFNFKFI